MPAPYEVWLRRQRESPRDTVVVVIFGTTTVEGGEPLSGRTVAPAAASCGCCVAAESGRLDAVARAVTDAVASGALNGTSARARTAPEAEASSTLTR